MERLDKFLSDSGAGTRSQVKLLLKAGRVSVDGKPEKDPAEKSNRGKILFFWTARLWADIRDGSSL